MIQIGNVGVGRLFLYNGGLFVVMPFDWDAEQYLNMCIATRNNDEFDIGEYYLFDEMQEVQEISTDALKDFIPKDFEKVVDK